jgi:hypothetical protein
MTKRTKRKRRLTEPRRAQPILLLMQSQCVNCGRYRLKSETCWFCESAWPTHCHCADSFLKPPASTTCGGHVHLEHALLERLSQLDYESIDESILLPTENWPTSADDVVDFEHEEIVGIANGGPTEPAPMRFKPARIPWRDTPEYKAFLGRYPDLRAKARGGIDSIFGFFALTSSEADVWSLDAAGYTREWIATQTGFRPGGVDALLESVQSKIGAKLFRLDREASNAS